MKNNRDVLPILLMFAGAALGTLVHGAAAIGLCLAVFGGIAYLIFIAKSFVAPQKVDISEIDDAMADIASEVSNIRQTLSDMRKEVARIESLGGNVETLTQSMATVQQGVAYILPVVAKTQELYKLQGL